MIKSYSCIIVDDEPHAIELLKESLTMVHKNLRVLHSFSTWSEALAGLIANKCDILFMDISIQGKNSMDLLKCIQDLKSEIIFITAHDQYAIKAFDFPTSGYLLKPIDDTELHASINRAIERIESKKQMLLEPETLFAKKIGISDKKCINYFDPNEILYLEAVNNYTRVCLISESFMSGYNLGKFKSLLPDYFFQIHRSFIINLNYVKRYETTGVLIMNNGMEIPISKAQRKIFLHSFSRISMQEGITAKS